MTRAKVEYPIINKVIDVGVGLGMGAVLGAAAPFSVAARVGVGVVVAMMASSSSDSGRQILTRWGSLAAGAVLGATVLADHFNTPVTHGQLDTTTKPEAVQAVETRVIPRTLQHG